MAKTKKIKAKGADLEQAMPKPSDENDWETQNHLDTIVKAHGIMSDPEKMKKVHKLAGRHMQAIRGIQDIKDHYNDKYGGKNARKNLSTLASGGEEMEGSGNGGEAGE